MDRATFDRGVQFVEYIRQEIETDVGAEASEVFANRYRKTRAEVRPWLLADLIGSSEREAAAWDGVRLIALRMLRDPEPLPLALASWVADVLEDASKPKKEKKRPRPRAPKKATPPSKPVLHANFARDWLVAVSVLALVNNGFTATRNKPIPRACFEGGSACDAVGVAFGLRGYKQMEGIWNASTVRLRPHATPRLLGPLELPNK